jgi:hypothetical protein
VTELPHNDNNGALYGLFGHVAAQIWLWGVKFIWNLFFPPALLLKPNVSEKIYKNAFFLILFIYLFSDQVCMEHANRHPFYI